MYLSDIWKLILFCLVFGFFTYIVAFTIKFFFGGKVLIILVTSYIVLWIIHFVYTVTKKK